tara:strand:- start:210 stop:419 length:210 start_codon:yes stop_codon:yes gene_type:complete
MSSVTMSMNLQNNDPVKEMEKHFNDIIENLRLNLQVAENRIRRLQDSEFKLESEIEILKEKLSHTKNIN